MGHYDRFHRLQTKSTSNAKPQFVKPLLLSTLPGIQFKELSKPYIYNEWWPRRSVIETETTSLSGRYTRTTEGQTAGSPICKLHRYLPFG